MTDDWPCGFHCRVLRGIRAAAKKWLRSPLFVFLFRHHPDADVDGFESRHPSGQSSSYLLSTDLLHSVPTSLGCALNYSLSSLLSAQTISGLRPPGCVPSWKLGDGRTVGNQTLGPPKSAWSLCYHASSTEGGKTWFPVLLLKRPRRWSPKKKA